MTPMVHTGPIGVNPGTASLLTSPNQAVPVFDIANLAATGVV